MMCSCEMCRGPVDIDSLFYSRVTGKLVCVDCVEAMIRVAGEP